MSDVTEKDLRAPDYREGEPSEYEFREDGKIVRKDRWERGIRNIASIIGCSRSFEIPALVDEVAAIVAAREAASTIDFCRLIDSLVIAWNSPKPDTSEVQQRRIDARAALEAAISKLSGPVKNNENEA